MLVNVIKQFTSEITVTNLDGTGKPANGRSLMKVVALGVKKVTNCASPPAVAMQNKHWLLLATQLRPVWARGQHEQESSHNHPESSL